MEQKKFNPDLNVYDGIFGLPFTEADSLLHIIPVPWDATSTGKFGSHNAPIAILNVSKQVDLYKEFYPDYIKHGIYMYPISKEILSLNNQKQEIAKVILDSFYTRSTRSHIEPKIEELNKASEIVNKYVYEMSYNVIKNNKIPLILGGNHSSIYGLLLAFQEFDYSFGILQIDAHADLRKSYLGLKYSHASIMYEIMQFEKIEKNVMVGIRDYSFEEEQRISGENKLKVFTNRYIYHRLYEGIPWQKISEEIVSQLPRYVYVSIDIDGLDCVYCPNTGTPVTGGLTTEQLKYLLEMICLSGRKIIGADLTEVVPKNEYSNDVYIATHLLLDLCMYTIYTHFYNE